MRLTAEQIKVILQTVTANSREARVYLFGSRLEDDKKGGDIDLIIESDKQIDSIIQSQIKDKLEQVLYLPFDILYVVSGKKLSTFEQLAKFDAVELNMEKTKEALKKQHLVEKLEAIERNIYFLTAVIKNLNFPLDDGFLSKNKNNIDLFTKLSALNEKFSKLQDVLASAMRHCAFALKQKDEYFLKILAFFEKNGVIESTQRWEKYRHVRNLAAHEYKVDYLQIAEHFNQLNKLTPYIVADAQRFINFCKTEVKL